MSKIHKPFQKLYIKKATGKTQEWETYIREEKSDRVYLCMEYGQVGGKKILKGKQIAKTKANRSYLDEALKQAETKYNKKVNKDGYSLNPNVSTTATVVRPMLANKFSPDIYDDPNKTPGIEFPCIGEPKCDGNRGIVYRKNGEVVIESRNATPIYYFDHIRKEVADLIEEMPETFYLDGELFTQDLPFNVINGLCNIKPSQKKKLSAKDQEKYLNRALYMAKVKYYIFDCFNTSSMDMSMKGRKEFLKKLFKNKKYKHLVFIEGEILQNISDVKVKHDEYVKKGGYEGIIVRNLNDSYKLK